MKGRLVRFMPKIEDMAPFTGWEGTSYPYEGVEAGMYRVDWRHKPQGLPELVHERHLSFRIKKFSKRFA